MSEYIKFKYINKNQSVLIEYRANGILDISKSDSKSQLLSQFSLDLILKF